MVLTEAVRMAEANTSPVNNVFVNNGANNLENVDVRVNSAETAPMKENRSLFGETGAAATGGTAPVYTSEKRAKFTQRENKKWVRLATVIGYLIAVCIPAIALSIYYIGFWDPHYKEEYLNATKLRDAHRHQTISMTRPEDRCYINCSCLAEAADAHSNRRPRELNLEKLTADKPPETASVTRNGYENVLVGKNYVIYGATADDSSPEVSTDYLPVDTKTTEDLRTVKRDTTSQATTVGV